MRPEKEWLVRGWRPDNWEEYRRKENIYPEAELWGHLFEAGADAILDALKQSQAVECLDGQHLKLFGSPDWTVWHLRGLIIFIPDKKEEDKNEKTIKLYRTPSPVCEAGKPGGSTGGGGSLIRIKERKEDK